MKQTANRNLRHNFDLQRRQWSRAGS